MKRKFSLIPSFKAVTEIKKETLSGGFSKSMNSAGAGAYLIAVDKNKDCPVIGNNCNGANCGKACIP